jgi:nitrite reductase/ring-hydroxylating ferredoxin subunit
MAVARGSGVGSIIDTMLTREENELITRTGPGTPMGDAMRRYWMPILLDREIAEPDGEPVKVQILGERLVALRDTDGPIGLLDEFCPHRRVSLWLGRNEECGLRCVYHGWKFDVNGNCRRSRAGSTRHMRPSCIGHCRARAVGQVSTRAVPSCAAERQYSRSTSPTTGTATSGFGRCQRAASTFAPTTM